MRSFVRVCMYTDKVSIGVLNMCESEPRGHCQKKRNRFLLEHVSKNETRLLLRNLHGDVYISSNSIWRTSIQQENVFQIFKSFCCLSMSSWHDDRMFLGWSLVRHATVEQHLRMLSYKQRKIHSLEIWSLIGNKEKNVNPSVSEV